MSAHTRDKIFRLRFSATNAFVRSKISVAIDVTPQLSSGSRTEAGAGDGGGGGFDGGRAGASRVTGVSMGFAGTMGTGFGGGSARGMGSGRDTGPRTTEPVR